MTSLFSQPKQPDLGQLQQAQNAASADAIRMQQHGNMINQTDAYGNKLTYNQIGTWGNGKGGKGGDPRYESVQTLSPEQQELLNMQTAGQKVYGQTALNLFNQAKGNLSQPFHYGPGEHEAWASGLYDKLSQPAINRNEEALRTRLANQGFQGGGAGYDAELQNFAQGNQNARDQFMLDSYGQGMQQALTERELPLNEATQMLTGVQAQQPGFGQTPQVSVPTFDAAGAMMNNYNQQMQNSQANWGALAGIAGAGLGGWASGGFKPPSFLSDRRAKKNITKVGRMDDGTNVYKFEYKKAFGGGLSHLGFMAQEIQKTHPSAVSERTDGLLQVDYDRVMQEMADGEEAA